MRFLQDKENKRYMGFLAVFCLLLAAVFLISWAMQGIWMRDSLFLWENTAASSLLAQGVPEETVALAFKNTEATAEGKALLAKIGHTEENSLMLFPDIRQGMERSGLLLLCGGAALCIVLTLGAVGYLRTRDRAYERADRAARQYADGDFSQRLSTGGTGTMERLFGTVDRLAAALKAKGESEKKAKEFLKDTISDISHQLKTPLAALHMYTEIISDEPGDTETVRTFAAKSEESLARIDRLLRLLLKVMRLDAGSVAFEKKEVHVEELAKAACADLCVRADQEKKALIFEGAEDTMLRCDEEWTAEALGNLVKNGLDHTQSGGCVKISWKRTPAMVRICVEDNGSGILPEDIHHIFKRFYRSSGDSGIQGVGLGLPLAKSIVEGQGGVLSVKSAPGEGTAFTLSFSDSGIR